MHQGIKCTDGLTQMTWFLLVHWPDITHRKHMQDTQGLIDWYTHIYEYILTPSVMCTQQLSVLHGMNNLLIQKFTIQRSTMPLFFKNCSLVEVMHLLIKFNKIMTFLWNTKNTDRNGPNRKRDKHQTHRER